jgi:hypothetical protein
MARPRPPWWIYAISASILGYLGLMVYADLFGPGGFGMGLRFRQGRVIVVEVVPYYPAARAGIEPGDQVVAVDGQPIKALLEWRIVAENAEVGRSSIVDIERDGRRREASVSFDVHRWHWGAGTWLAFAAKVIRNNHLRHALVIARRRGPRGARQCAQLASLDAISPPGRARPRPSLPPGAAAVWRSVPLWLTSPLWIGMTTFLVGPTLSAVFLSIFPRPVFRTRRAWWLWSLYWGPLSVVGISMLMFRWYLSVYDPTHAAIGLPVWFTPFIGVAVMTAQGVALTLLAINYRRLLDQNERRRVRVLMLGIFVGLGGTVPIAMASFFDLPPVLQNALRSPAARASASVLFLAVPLSVAYAILRHRLLDVGLIIGQGCSAPWHTDWSSLCRPAPCCLSSTWSFTATSRSGACCSRAAGSTRPSRGWRSPATRGSSDGSRPSISASSGSATMRSGSCATWWRKRAGGQPGPRGAAGRGADRGGAAPGVRRPARAGAS